MRKLSTICLLISATALTQSCALQPVVEYEDTATTTTPIHVQDRVKHIVHFEYDSKEVSFEQAGVIERHVRHLLKNPSVRVRLQGNASNDGARAYNYDLALARAESVKDIMVQLGVAPTQIMISSIGEQRATMWPAQSVKITY